jgi:hypothetical protein
MPRVRASLCRHRFTSALRALLTVRRFFAVPFVTAQIRRWPVTWMLKLDAAAPESTMWRPSEPDVRHEKKKKAPKSNGKAADAEAKPGSDKDSAGAAGLS